MAKKSVIYRIRINNWDRHNVGRKKAYSKTLIANNFCTDNKLGTLPLSHRWLFLGILLECGSSNRDIVEMNERQLRVMLESSKSVSRVLDSLQSLQLLSYEIYDPLIKKDTLSLKKERKEKESKGDNDKFPVPSETVTATEAVAAKATPAHQLLVVSSAEDLVRFVPEKFWKNWSLTYDEAFIREEVVKMTSWLMAHPPKNRKTERGLAQFVGGWLNRGWDQYLKRGRSNRPERQEELLR